MEKTTEETTEFKDEHIAVKLKRHPGSKIVFDITVSPVGAAASHAKAIKNINKEVTLPGFRKGKAPDSLITTKYPKQLHEEWLQILLKTAFNDALKLTNLEPFNNNSVRCLNVGDLSKEKGAKFTIEFEAPPVVPRIDLAHIHLHPMNRLPVTDRDVDQVVRNIQLYHSNWTDITDRPIQEGDFVDLDIVSLEEPNNSICKDTRFEVKKGIMAKWMHDLLLGVSLNESVEGTSEKEDDSHSHHHDDDGNPPEFRPTKCRITVKTIKVPDLPELNDEFTKKVGAINVDDLKTKILADLNRRADDRTKNAMHRQLDDSLLKHYHFEVPVSLVEAEIEHRSAAHRQWLEHQNAPEDAIEEEMRELEEKLPGIVDNGLRLLFLLLGYAKEHAMEVSHEELMTELSNQIMHGLNLQQPGIDLENVRARINQSLLLRKSRDRIIEQLIKNP